MKKILTVSFSMFLVCASLYATDNSLDSRLEVISEQVQMHNELNEWLVLIGEEPQPTFYEAIKKARGFVANSSGGEQYYLEINKKANKAKHQWDVEQ